MIYIILAIILAYFLGSIPTAYIFGKVLKGIDIRRHGSGNVGATNVFRTVGKVSGIIVLVIDFLKGFIAVTLLPFYLQKFLPEPIASYPFNIVIFLGAAAVCGHIWTVFLGFKGGKGVATMAGVVAGLSAVVLFSCLGVWILVFAIWRYVSLASIVVAVILPVFAIASGGDLYFLIFCAIFSIIGIYRHRENIKRLIQGTEKKLL